MTLEQASVPIKTVTLQSSFRSPCWYKDIESDSSRCEPRSTWQVSASRRLNLRACCSAAGGIPQAANGKATLSGYSRLADPPAGRTVEARQLRDGYPGELITRKYIVAVTLPAWLLSRVPSAGLRLPRYGCGCGDCRSRGIPIQIRPEGSCPSLCI